MDLINKMNCNLSQAEGVFTLKNKNTTLGFVRFNDNGEVEYIFVNPLFRKKKYIKKTVKTFKTKNKKKTYFSKTYKSSWFKIIRIYKERELKVIFF